MRALLLLALLTAGPALAHEGHQHAQGDFSIELDPVVVAPLLLSALFYVRGVTCLWRRAGLGRGVAFWQVACFALGWLVLALALVSPLHDMGRTNFTAHMVEHELLMVVAAPLMVVARPIGAWLWALPPATRRAIGLMTRRPGFAGFWRVLTDPLMASGLHAVALWFWHVPRFFEATLESGLMHRSQHVSFLGTALLFWWVMLEGKGRVGAMGAAALHLFATSIHASLLGSLFVFSSRLWYPAQTQGAPALGLSPLEDQQLGGLVMWVVACFIYVVAGLWLLGRWIQLSATHREEKGHALQAR
ncbi:MAG TPA: cytochrome c oxidase assembly protein [Roseomonas sp.]|jgi:cytochrome c oxidase assembly factor CtaG